jgi:GDPmannose 4,6-dehydratase
MLQHDKPDDYVVATGESHSVREFVEAAARILDMDIRWTGKGLDEVGVDQNGRIIIRVAKELYRPAEVHSLRGDYSKARQQLGWQPEISFKKLVEMMVRSDLDRQNKIINAQAPQALQ